jgi:phage major head subunit gpT-like protein
MAVPSALRSSYGDLFSSSMLPVLEELFRTAFEQRKMIREDLFKVVPSDRDIWQYSELHDMPVFSSVSEGSDYSFSRPKAGNNKTLTALKYGLGYSISEEAVEDGKIDLIADAIRKMGESARETQEQAAMDVFNNGFSSQTVADGLSLFNASHTTPTGSITFRNKLAVDSDLSYSSLQTAIQDFGKQFRGDSGIYKAIQPKILLVPQELKLYAQELVGSEGKVDSGDNNINSIKGEGLQVRVSPRLTDANAFFLVSDPMENGLRIVSRKPLETMAAAPDSVGFLNDAIYYKARYREKVDAVHAYGVFASPGAS